MEPVWQGGTRDADLIHVALRASLDFESGRIVGTVQNAFRSLRAGTDRIRLHSRGIEIREVTGGDGQALGYRERDGFLEISLETPMAVGDEASIEVEFSATPASGYHSSLTRGEEFAPSAHGSSFPDGLRPWIPTWDAPGELATMDTQIVLRDDLSAVANGVLIAVDTLPGAGPGQKVFTWRSLTEIPVRSMAIAAGAFDTFAAKAGETELYFHLPAGTDPETAQRTFGESTAVLEYFTRKLGRPFPFPRYDQAVLSDLPALMLDGASLTMIDATELPSVADELDDRRERPRRTVARGAARKWFGAWLAPLQERHRWLLDGLALTLELDYESRVRGLPEVELEWDSLRDSVIRRSEERLVVESSEGVVVALAREEMAERAAWVLRILRARLGEETFWRLIQAFVGRDTGRLVTVEDFRRLCLSLTGLDIGPEIAQWTGRVTVPELHIRFQRRSVKGVGESLGIVVDQVQPGPLFRVSLPIEVHFAGGIVRFEELVIDKKTNLVIVPLDDRVVDVAIDPEGVVLASFSIEKDDASWIAQGSLSRSSIDRARALPRLDELSATSEEARAALIRILRMSPEPSLRERTTQWMRFQGPACNLALKQAAAEDLSPLVRRAALHSLLQRFAQGDWIPGADELELFLQMEQRETSPAVLEKLEQIRKTVPQSE
ncbi:Peptidase family M1 [Planctomycetes bacterium Poly30]|uniref:Transcription initiation factor TFIID subunit 2 n=2 Tax=Saltatorellus ferox TaxID=2528018 RepID=A0A518EUK3_9BACT|nr:Peptidase family M1 [Planctomycetes bacterium Poly30]